MPTGCARLVTNAQPVLGKEPGDGGHSSHPCRLNRDVRSRYALPLPCVTQRDRMAWPKRRLWGRHLDKCANWRNLDIPRPAAINYPTECQTLKRTSLGHNHCTDGKAQGRDGWATQPTMPSTLFGSEVRAAILQTAVCVWPVSDCDGRCECWEMVGPVPVRDNLVSLCWSVIGRP